MFVGFLVELYLTIDKLVFGHAIGQRPLLLLGALLIIVGVQLLSLGLIGELIANSRARSGPDPAQVARASSRRAGGRAGRDAGGRPRPRAGAALRAGDGAGLPTAVTRGVAYFGTYDPGYPRNAVLIAGLRELGVTVHEFGAPLPTLTAAADGDGRRRGPPAGGARGRTRRLLAQHRRDLDVDTVDRRLSRPLPRAVRRACSRRSPARVSSSTRSSRCGTPSPATALWCRRAAGRRASLRGRRPRRLRAARTSCSPTPGRTPPTTRRSFGLPRRRLAVVPVGALPEPRPTARPRACRGRAAHRLPVRQVEPAARRRRGARRRPSCCATSPSASCSPARASSRPRCGRRSPRAASRNVEWLGALKPRRAARPDAGRRRVPRACSAARRRRRAWSPTRCTTRWPAAGPSSPPASAGARELLQRRRETRCWCRAGDARRPGRRRSRRLRDDGERGRARRGGAGAATAAPAPRPSSPATARRPGGARERRRGDAARDARSARRVASACCASRSSRRSRRAYFLVAYLRALVGRASATSTGPCARAGWRCRPSPSCASTSCRRWPGGCCCAASRCAARLSLAIATWAKSILARYIPGNVFMFVGRAWMSHEQGLPLDRVTRGHGVRAGAAACCSALVAVALLFPFWEYHRGLTALSLLAIPVLVALLHPRVFAPLAGARAAPAAPAASRGDPELRRRARRCSATMSPPGCWPASAPGSLARAVTGLEAGALPLVIVAYALAYVVGMAAFVFPSGIGVREAVLAAVARAASCRGGVALAWALLLRLWVTVHRAGLRRAWRVAGRGARADGRKGRDVSNGKAERKAATEGRAAGTAAAPSRAAARPLRLALAPVAELDARRVRRASSAATRCYVLAGAVAFAVVYSPARLAQVPRLHGRPLRPRQHGAGGVQHRPRPLPRDHDRRARSRGRCRGSARTSTPSSPLFALPWLVWPSPVMLLVLQAVDRRHGRLAGVPARRAGHA